MANESRLLLNYAKTLEEISEACLKCGRQPEDVELVAVSKFHPVADIAAVAGAGQINFGENYVQEAEEKMKALRPVFPDLRWHMIGHVQSRKASRVAGAFYLLHTLDSVRLADALERKLAELDIIQKALVEVNIADEEQKSGIAASNLQELGEHVLAHCPHISLRGLMCLPPVFDSGEAARPFFERLRELRDALEPALGLALPQLSMGMSGDFAGAIAEGATIVRIGTEIFGPRPAGKKSL